MKKLHLLKYLPLLCPGCGSDKYPALAGGFCPECKEKLIFFDPQLRCPGCGGENFSALEFCQQCLDEPPRPWNKALAVFAYRTSGKELIRRFKFNGTPELARPLGMMAAELLANSDIHPEYLVPIPLTLPRSIIRTYNQSKLVAEMISSISGIPVLSALSRKFTLRHQAMLDRKARHKGLLKEFRTRKDVRNRKLLLIDDVLTTGATLSAAATALLDAGAAGVDILVLARAISYSAKISDPVPF